MNPSLRAAARALAALGVATAVTSLALSAPASAANPPGNNGTVKMDAEAFDDAPNNEPHVGCEFQVDFYGYDEGDLFADVTFTAHPPTGPVQTLLTDVVSIGEDDNSGGGSEAGLDASATYVLDFGTIEPHPVAGLPREAHRQRRRQPGRGRQAQGVLGDGVRRAPAARLTGTGREGLGDGAPVVPSGRQFRLLKWNECPRQESNLRAFRHRGSRLLKRSRCPRQESNLRAFRQSGEPAAQEE